MVAAMSKEEVHARITNQFRKRQSMVYDLSCHDVRLTVEITPSPSDAGSSDWSVRAHARQAPEQPFVDETGATREAALRAVAIAWTAKGGAYGFPALDWEAVVQALHAVRAL